MDAARNYRAALDGQPRAAVPTFVGICLTANKSVYRNRAISNSATNVRVLS
jgi:hypothetical protein